MLDLFALPLVLLAAFVIGAIRSYVRLPWIVMWAFVAYIPGVVIWAGIISPIAFYSPWWRLMFGCLGAIPGFLLGWAKYEARHELPVVQL